MYKKVYIPQEICNIYLDKIPERKYFKEWKNPHENIEHHLFEHGKLIGLVENLDMFIAKDISINAGWCDFTQCFIVVNNGDEHLISIYEKIVGMKLKGLISANSYYARLGRLFGYTKE